MRPFGRSGTGPMCVVVLDRLGNTHAARQVGLTAFCNAVDLALSVGCRPGDPFLWWEVAGDDVDAARTAPSIDGRRVLAHLPPR